MLISSKDKQHLKGLAHKLKPIVFVGINGLTDAVIKEAARALHDHELIKVRIQTQDREQRKMVFHSLCETLDANAIQLIGNVGTLFRPNESE